MRVLFTSWPGHGHLLPMLPLIRSAQQAGHQVLVSSGADLQPVIDRLGLPAHVSGQTLAESYAAVPGDLNIGALPPAEQAEFAARHFFGSGAVARAADVATLIDRWRPDLLVHDILELGGPAVAERAGVRHVTHGYGPTVPGTAFMVSVFDEVLHDAGWGEAMTGVMAAPYLDVCPPGLPHGEPLPWNDVRPIRPTAGEAPPEAGAPVEMADLPFSATVYLTLGTVTNLAPQVFRAVIEAATALEFNVVATTGPDQDPAALGPLPPSVRAVPFAPQAVLLPHCRAVVSHTGAGTMFGALCLGLPQLCLPQGTDQPANAAAVAAAGAGLVLDGKIEPELVRTALARVVTEPSFTAAAERLAGQIAAMPPADAVLPLLLTPPSG